MLVSYICSKDLHNGMHDGMILANWKPCQKRINLSDRLKSTGSLKSSQKFLDTALQKKCQIQAELAYMND